MANQDENLLKKIIAHSKEYGFIFPSSEIYEGLGAVYDYGQNGTELKNNIKDYWWKSLVQLNEEIVGIDSAIFMHPTTWKASGHLEAFNDPLIDNKDSKKRYRADSLIEDEISKLEARIDKEVTKAKKRFGDDFDLEKFVSTSPRVKKYKDKIVNAQSRLKKALETGNLKDLEQLIRDLDITDPVSGSRNWTEVRQFNLMFSTELGSVSDESNKIYLRPETAQGIFVNFLNVLKTGRMKLPFGIAQIGKAFRNEIVARQFIFRMREFEQMEMQYFIKPGEEEKWYEIWKEKRMKWHHLLGIPNHYYKFHDHLNLAHYAKAACDIEFKFPMGFKELEGIHSRTDYDLSAHEEFSGKKQRFFDPQKKNSYIPFVIETSIGLDRMFLAILTSAYHEEKLEDGSERVVMKIPPVMAPVKVAILPLLKKDGLPEKALKIFNEVKLDFNCDYDEKDSIGKRYRRHDAIGTPLSITIDHQTLEDDTVTIRDRDTMEQVRSKIPEVREKVAKIVSLKNILSKL